MFFWHGSLNSADEGLPIHPYFDQTSEAEVMTHQMTTAKEIPKSTGTTSVVRSDRSRLQTEQVKYEEHRRRVGHVCRNQTRPPHPTNLLWLVKKLNNPLISTRTRALFCPVGKVASTFFTRFLMIIEQPSLAHSPYDIPIEKASRESIRSLKSLRTLQAMSSFITGSTSIVFGRNPYSRIFSAYIDKMLSPNPYYWKSWGEKALKMSSILKANGTCASNVTFEQFLKAVALDLYKRDLHLKMVSAECQMCALNYSIVGRLETMREDVDYIAARLNVSSGFQHEPDYGLAAAMDSVKDTVDSAFSWRPEIGKCISFDEMGRRIWRKFQIRGVIDSNIHYPFRPDELADMRTETFIAACRAAILASKDKAQLKKQKNQALLEAYSSVNITLLYKISHIYSDDLTMFDYEKLPDKLFKNRDKIEKTGYLDWWTPWNLR
ncbi:uncharacterized protein LOC131955073 isoform X2 [Physella acuta]|uniref:uncharacterized protein LOC131955072 isoform X2 n=1 Tax=Physella acuta TaxID=109671 RepID=UPI0027DC6EB1|nr:uncharacterized protein LOC131955072 isoform X2 [Physella acuta]XP_059175009.1 uncharacterized protein LOC131955073 isoform X2 [Physella acuta]